MTTKKDQGNIIYKSVIVCKCEPKAPGEHLNYIEKAEQEREASGHTRLETVRILLI